MSALWILLQLAGGVLLLYFGAEWLIKGGVSIAERLGVSPLIIGLTLVAFATSAPELVVSLEAALNGNSDISVGNVVGSNICNIALILGLSALIAPLRVQLQLLRFDMPILLLASLLFAGFGLVAGGFNRWAGGVLLVGFCVYTTWNIVASRRTEKDRADAAMANPAAPPHSWLWSVAIAAAGLAALVAGAKLFVSGAIAVGQLAGLSDAVIGLTIVAVGTSLPELATSVVAAIRRQQDIAIGNVVGSNIFNILGIMGITPLIRPIPAVGLGMVDWGMMLLTAILLLPFMRSKFIISRLEGAILLLLFIGYTTFLILTS
ncbi:calcium/sodium antiporter [Victivallis sp. Marseille-Q1083]|uniref:calcium/sodium antiporter n=1 Tax=Victivallis sp. Marseille-Q1083 TaxID=2717288 RepID=UPI00158C0112|nr:calcium/sodium antiporter [Victivallis sp. Marseille-Q1083]